jgi:serine/threonine protein kinase
MPLVRGETLRERLARVGELPVAEAVKMLRDVASALAGAHREGIVHRDVKPDNIVLRGGDWATPVIIDLGLSRLLDMSSMTIYPWAWGTWPYMAPEQIRGERAIPQTDLWALGVVAAELGDGAHPFQRVGEHSPPPDWLQRIEGGAAVSGSRPGGLRDFVDATVQMAAYRRPSAPEAVQLLDSAWPQP